MKPIFVTKFFVSVSHNLSFSMEDFGAVFLSYVTGLPFLEPLIICSLSVVQTMSPSNHYTLSFDIFMFGCGLFLQPNRLLVGSL